MAVADQFGTKASLRIVTIPYCVWLGHTRDRKSLSVMLLVGTMTNTGLLAAAADRQTHSITSSNSSSSRSSSRSSNKQQQQSQWQRDSAMQTMHADKAILLVLPHRTCYP